MQESNRERRRNSTNMQAFEAPNMHTNIKKQLQLLHEEPCDEKVYTDFSRGGGGGGGWICIIILGGIMLRVK